MAYYFFSFFCWTLWPRVLGPEAEDIDVDMPRLFIEPRHKVG